MSRATLGSVSLSTVRRALHATHAVATLLLLGTGLLLEFPELRARFVGGYGTRIVTIHLWAGAAFAGIPLLALAISYRGLLEDLRRRLGPPDPWGFRKSHIVVSLGAGFLLSLTGLILWRDTLFPVSVGDGSRWIHLALTVVIAVEIPVHLFAARRKIRQRVREWLGREEPPDSFFDFDSDPGAD